MESAVCNKNQLNPSIICVASHQRLHSHSIPHHLTYHTYHTYHRLHTVHVTFSTMGILKSLRKKKKNLLEKNNKDLNNDKDDNTSMHTRIVQSASTIISSSTTAPPSPADSSITTHGSSESPALSLINSKYAREHPLPPNSNSNSNSNKKSRSPPVVQFSKKNIIIEHEMDLTQTLSAADSFDETFTYDASTVATFKSNSSDTSMHYLWRYLTCNVGTKSTFDLLREADDMTIDSVYTDLTDRTEKSGNDVARQMYEL